MNESETNQQNHKYYNSEDLVHHLPRGHQTKTCQIGGAAYPAETPSQGLLLLLRHKSIGYSNTGHIKMSDSNGRRRNLSFDQKMLSSKGGALSLTNCIRFPLKLFQMLEDVEKSKKESIVSWSVDGNSFRVHKTDEFAEKVMPQYFPGQTRYKSFQRQLHIYDFARITEGRYKGGYEHPKFKKSERDLSQEMVPLKRKLAKKVQEREGELFAETICNELNNFDSVVPQQNSGGPAEANKEGELESQNQVHNSFFGMDRYQVFPSANMANYAKPETTQLHTPNELKAVASETRAASRLAYIYDAPNPSRITLTKLHPGIHLPGVDSGPLHVMPLSSEGGVHQDGRMASQQNNTLDAGGSQAQQIPNQLFADMQTRALLMQAYQGPSLSAIPPFFHTQSQMMYHHAHVGQRNLGLVAQQLQEPTVAPLHQGVLWNQEHQVPLHLGLLAQLQQQQQQPRLVLGQGSQALFTTAQPESNGSSAQLGSQQANVSSEFDPSLLEPTPLS
jgi:hypothetical protein